MARNCTCSLCLDDIKEEEEFQTQCGHSYHKKCFTNLTILNKHKDCPMCRRPFEEEWFLNSKNDFKEFMNIANEQELQQFQQNWKWWTDYFEGRLNDQNQMEADENWNDFLRMEEGDGEWVEGFNPGNRPRVDVNPELVVWEREVEDLFEEAEMIRRRQEALGDFPEADEIDIAPEVLERIDEFLREADNED